MKIGFRDQKINTNNMNKEHTQKTKDLVTRTTLKPGVNSGVLFSKYRYIYLVD